MVTHTAALKWQCAAGRSQQVGDAGTGPERCDVERSAIRVGAFEAVSGDVAVDQTRMAGQHRGVIDAGPGKRRGAHIGDKHVSASNQFGRHGASGIRGQIESDTAFAAVVELEHRVVGHVTTHHLGEGARRVPGQWFDLHHIGPPVGQYPGSRWSSDPHAEFHHPYAVHGSSHHDPPKCSVTAVPVLSVSVTSASVMSSMRPQRNALTASIRHPLNAR